MSYDFIDQQIVSSCLIQAHTDDSFYNPIVNSHTGFAFDGNFYSLGVLQPTHAHASWFTEFGTNPFRGNQAAFPSFGLALLSPVSLVILNQGTPVVEAVNLPLWMQFILGDNNALANNFDGAEHGFTPTTVCYADGVISVTYAPDSGNQSFPHPTLVATITATSLTSNVLTVTAGNSFSAGQNVQILGTAEAFLNNQTVNVVSANATQFTANFTHTNFTNNLDTGTATATLPFVPPFPTPYPIVAVQSSMIVSMDFVQDSVYLDVAV